MDLQMDSCLTASTDATVLAPLVVLIRLKGCSLSRES